jgi:hypothetical protein
MNTITLDQETPRDQIERLRAMATDHGETWDLSDNDRAAIRFALGQIEHHAPLLATAPELLEALEELFKLVEDGVLVRSTTADGDPGWAMKQLPLVLTLSKTHAAIKKARGE